jgi:hypothetical protein
MRPVRTSASAANVDAKRATGSRLLPPSRERWITCPNQPLGCDAESRSAASYFRRKNS